MMVIVSSMESDRGFRLGLTAKEICNRILVEDALSS